MKFAVAMVVLLAAAVPATEAKTARGSCLAQAQSQYKFCLNRSTTRKGKAMCKVSLRQSRKQCPK
ncbi:MAG TPA: hypothetical protein VGN17_23290 [Bryobacteraceae bacterium]